MKLSNVHISNLYGRFDYDIDLNLDEDITILTAPNGYGKTAVISIIYNLFTGRLDRLSGFRFTSASFQFDDSTTINVSGVANEEFDFLEHPLRHFKVETVLSDGESEIWYFDSHDQIRKSSPPIERFIPHVNRTSDGYFDSIHEDLISYFELIERYRDIIPASYSMDMPDKPKFNEVVKQIECHLIETQRLLKHDPTDRKRPQSVGGQRAAVAQNARDLAQKIESATKAYAAAAQRLDQTFPERVLRQLPSDAPNQDEIRQRLVDLEERRHELSLFGLVEKSETNLLGYEPTLADQAVRNILSLYAQDSDSKLSTFEELFSKIELFSSICNAHFTFKNLVIDSDVGMLVVDDEGRDIPLTSLSSGEQHILVLIYDLLFRVSKGALILVDEPELSLHVAWQKRFIADLQQIQSIQPMSIMVATHSPQIINDRWDLEVALEAQV